MSDIRLEFDGLNLNAVNSSTGNVVQSWAAISGRPGSQIEQGEAFCEQRYFDDGHVRFSSSPSERNNCCIMERRMISDNRRSYRLLACDMQNVKPISCGSVESYGTTKWVVDKRTLRVDESWEEHESEFIYNIGE